ncbi:MAG: hypothetical protein AAF556_02400 [Pseudomonadota bacterium]
MTTPSPRHTAAAIFGLSLLGACTIVPSNPGPDTWAAAPIEADYEFRTSLGPGWAYARNGGGFTVRLPSVGEFQMPGDELTAMSSAGIPSPAGPVDFTVLEYRADACPFGYVGVLAKWPEPLFYKLGDCRTRLVVLRRDGSGDPVGLLDSETDEPIYAIYPDRIALLASSLAPAPLPAAKPSGTAPLPASGMEARRAPPSPSEPFEVPPVGRLDIE